MSYILQALKDSQQERDKIQSENSTAPVAVAVLAPAPRKRSNRLVISILAIGLIVAAGLYLYNRTPSVQPVATSPSPANDSTVINPVQTVTADEPDMRGVKLIIDTPQSQPRGDESVRPASLQSSKQRSEPVASSRKAVATANAPAALEEPVEADPYANLPYLRQLPVSTQREIPELKFSVHIYSESRVSRMIKLNNRMMREGQRVAPDLNIEAIIPRAVVFNYKGELFKVPAR